MIKPRPTAYTCLLLAMKRLLLTAPVSSGRITLEINDSSCWDSLPSGTKKVKWSQWNFNISCTSCRQTSRLLCSHLWQARTNRWGSTSLIILSKIKPGYRKSGNSKSNNRSNKCTKIKRNRGRTRWQLRKFWEHQKWSKSFKRRNISWNPKIQNQTSVLMKRPSIRDYRSRKLTKLNTGRKTLKKPKYFQET